MRGGKSLVESWTISPAPLEIPTFFLGLQTSPDSPTTRTGGFALSGQRLQSLTQKSRQPNHGQLTVPPLGALFSSHNSQTTIKQARSKPLFQPGQAEGPKTRTCIQIEPQLNTRIRGVDALSARA
jgi:hypothetical protein